MRLRTVPLAVAAVVLTACGTGNEVTPAAPAPTGVTCGDGLKLRQRAVDDRRQADHLKSDHEKIYVGNRAGFFASLAIIADLKCKVPLAETDEPLRPAFEAARKAESTSSMYERAIRWSEADFIASQVAALLIQQLPAK
jgi:hypothetical protein